MNLLKKINHMYFMVVGFIMTIFLTIFSEKFRTNFSGCDCKKNNTSDFFFWWKR